MRTSNVAASRKYNPTPYTTHKTKSGQPIETIQIKEQEATLRSVETDLSTVVDVPSDTVITESTSAAAVTPSSSSSIWIKIGFGAMIMMMAGIAVGFPLAVSMLSSPQTANTNGDPATTIANVSTGNTSTGTTTLATTASTIATTIATTTIATTTLSTAVTYSLTSLSETIYPIWNTTAGGGSAAATNGTGLGSYPSNEGPTNMLDFNLNTKYLSFGSCPSGTSTLACGQNTGVYFTPVRGASLLRSLRFCTANDVPERDPILVTIEGSNQTSALTQGSSWILIYNGSTGLDINPGRFSFGTTQFLNNSVWYLSYRLIIVAKRAVASATQYAEVQFFGY